MTEETPDLYEASEHEFVVEHTIQASPERISKGASSEAEPTNEPTSTQDQDWGRISLCVVIAILAALAVHYVVFGVLIAGTTLPPTAHALVGMVLFFFAGFVSFSVFY